MQSLKKKEELDKNISNIKNDLINIVRDRVKELFPSVSIERLTINRLDDTNTIQLNITYSIQSFVLQLYYLE